MHLRTNEKEWHLNVWGKCIKTSSANVTRDRSARDRSVDRRLLMSHTHTDGML